MRKHLLTPFDPPGKELVQPSLSAGFNLSLEQQLVWGREECPGGTSRDDSQRLPTPEFLEDPLQTTLEYAQAPQHRQRGLLH